MKKELKHKIVFEDVNFKVTIAHLKQYGFIKNDSHYIIPLKTFDNGALCDTYTKELTKELTEQEMLYLINYWHKHIVPSTDFLLTQKSNVESVLADQFEREARLNIELNTQLENEKKLRYKLEADKRYLIEILLDTKRSQYEKDKNYDLPF